MEKKTGGPTKRKEKGARATPGGRKAKTDHKEKKKKKVRGNHVPAERGGSRGVLTLEAGFKGKKEAGVKTKQHQRRGEEGKRGGLEKRKKKRRRW